MRANRPSVVALRTLAPILVTALVALLLLLCPAAFGSGPRWVSGVPYFNYQGAPVLWYTAHLQYFTDPGDLSPSVDHTAADALVARAAAVWNIPTASLVLGRGGALEEHVSSANVATGTAGLTLPSDLQPANYLNKQIAVIYDSDGSVTDLMLGAGASDPTGCRQAAVTESVDSFGPNAQILHAVLVLNGRCTGPEPDKQVQLQYQLVRAFGRVLGLGWSQTNDNTFTGVPTPTPTQVANWPVMHPIDIICGPYTYKCTPDPFTLRPDDVASLAATFPIEQGQATAGKQDTLGNGFTLDGYVTLGNGQGMEGVNVTARRHHMFWATVEDWQSVSSVSGFSFRRQAATAVTPADPSPLGSIGSFEDWREGYFRMTGIQIGDFEAWETLILSTEPINPLYMGVYAVGPYNGNTIAPSGSPLTLESELAPRYGFNRNLLSPAGAATQCAADADGTAASPAPVPAQGWWTAALCGYNHSAWNTLPVRAGRTLTLEVTALDEQGNATMVKAMPVLGAWKGSDDPAAPPTLGASPAAFNSFVGGMTRLPLSTATPATVRWSISDQRGTGRPDFAYQARVLYADTITPANVATTGGSVTITGMGFRPGMAVLVRGVAASVTSVSATRIVATVPTLRALGASRPLVADVTVSDPVTAGSSTMTAALGYASSSERLQLLSVPQGSIDVGAPAATAFAVQVVGSDGVTPVAGESVTFTATGAEASFGACGRPVCTLLTDARGLASTTLTPAAAGAFMLSVATPSVTLSPFRLVATVVPDLLRLVSAPAGVQTTGIAAAVPFAIRLTAADGVTPRAGQTVTFAASGTAATLGACGGALCTAVTDSAGVAGTSVTVLTPGTATLTATNAAGAVSAALTAAAPSIRLVTAPSAAVTVGSAAATAFAVVVLGGDGVSPLPGEAVAFLANGGGVRFSACSAATCTVLTDARGVASVAVTPTLPGTVALSAASRAGSVTSTFAAGPPALRVLAAPSGSVRVGSVAAPAWNLQLLEADGTSPRAHQPVELSLTAGAAGVSGCVVLPCMLETDGQGRVVVGITPLAAGTVTLTATAAGATQTVTLLATALPDVVQTVALPGGTLFPGDGAATPFAVRVLTGDLRSAVAGVAVTFTSTGGDVLFQACGATRCVLTTDSTGLASTAVTAVSAGLIYLQAAAAAGSITADLTVTPRHRSLVALRPVLYVAESASFSWVSQVALTDDSGPVENSPISWSGSGALHFATAQSVAQAAVASASATISPLGAGVTEQGTACAWINLCVPLAAVGVSGAELHLAVVSGTGQSLAPADRFAPVRLRVTDTAGHPVVGAVVQLRQTVTAWQAPCASQGRCGQAAVLATGAAAAVSDIDGAFTVEPLDVPGSETVTSMAASVGTVGFATLTVEHHP